MGEGRTPPLPGHSQRRGQAGNRTVRPSENSTSRHAWGLRLRLGDLPDFGEALAVRAAVMLKIERNMLFLPFGAGVAAPFLAMGLHSGGPFDSYEYTSFTGVSQAPDEIWAKIPILSFYGLVRLCGRLVESSIYHQPATTASGSPATTANHSASARISVSVISHWDWSKSGLL